MTGGLPVITDALHPVAQAIVCLVGGLAHRGASDLRADEAPVEIEVRLDDSKALAA